jgi:hypothetical protein
VTNSSPPLTFQTFNFTEFSGLASVSWDQPVFTEGLHQFGNIHLSAPVPEPSSLVLLASGGIALFGYAGLRNVRAARRSGRESPEST